MENRGSRPLAGISKSPESEPDPIKDKVAAWVETYTAQQESRKPIQYQTPPEVAAWFTDYQKRYDIHEDSHSIGKDPWIKISQELRAEYDQKMELAEYKLYALQKEVADDPTKQDDYEKEIKRLTEQLQRATEEQWWIDNKDKTPPRNLLTHFEETANVMADIEGGVGWANGQVRDQYSLLEALKFLEEHKNRTKDDEHINFEIYGDGGANRWYVYQDGTIKFLKPRFDKAEKITRRGFPLMGD